MTSFVTIFFGVKFLRRFFADTVPLLVVTMVAIVDVVIVAVVDSIVDVVTIVVVVVGGGVVVVVVDHHEVYAFAIQQNQPIHMLEDIHVSVVKYDKHYF